MGLRDSIRRLKREAAGEYITIPQRDGPPQKFAETAYEECFLHEYERGRRSHNGEAPGPAHPMVEALRNASEHELQRLASEEGTIILHWLGEDEIYRGERERPGPPVRETSPGVYE